MAGKGRTRQRAVLGAVNVVTVARMFGVPPSVLDVGPKEKSVTVTLHVGPTLLRRGRVSFRDGRHMRHFLGEFWLDPWTGEVTLRPVRTKARRA